jgi:lysophospholipase L1-like esterase
LPQYTRLLCAGDSITYGARSSHGRTYPQLLEERLTSIHTGVPSIALNRGVNGETSWQIVDRVQQYLLDDPWIKVCITMFGCNDSKPHIDTPIDFYLSQWDRLKRICDCTDTLLYALGIISIDPVGQPEYDEKSVHRIKDFNDATATWASSAGVPYIDGLFDLFQTDPTLLADGIHPTNEGNQVIADRVFDVLGKPRPYQA